MACRLLICSEEDAASVNIRDALTGSAEWESDGRFLYRGDMVIMSVPGMHIHSENIDDTAKEEGIDAKELIFLSRHKAASGIPTLTVHPIGNFRDADLGGRPRTLARSSPVTMSGLLRSLASADTGHFRVSFEVTHHGPWVDIPATFIEIGSDASQWDNREAAKMIADAVLGCEENDAISVIGIGGGHYAPRFTEVAISYEINFGHMIPEYAFKGSDEDDLIRMIKDSAANSGTRTAYIHKKSMNAETLRYVTGAALSCGLEVITSKDLDRVTGK